MSKKNNKEKVTYKQLMSYLDFMNAKMNQKFAEIDNAINGVGYFLKSYVEFNKDDKKFQEFLKKKEEEAAIKKADELGSESLAKSEKQQKS